MIMAVVFFASFEPFFLKLYLCLVLQAWVAFLHLFVICMFFKTVTARTDF